MIFKKSILEPSFIDLVTLAALIYFLLVASIVRAASDESKVEYIAHAGGSVNGYTYTNSVESLAQQMVGGKTYIEIDLRVSSDGKIVGVHDWREFKGRCGLQDSSLTPMSYKQVKHCKLDGMFEPLGEKDIKSFFENNKNKILVTDKIRNLDILDRAFKFKKRIIVESFSRKMCEEVQSRGFLACILKVNLSIRSIARALYLRPFGVTIDYRAISGGMFSSIAVRLLRFLGIKLFLYTINDYEQVKKFLGSDIIFVYTDLLR